MMLGYVHKDQAQPHFKIAKHNIDNNDVLRGIAEWQTAKLSYEDDKIMVTKSNLFHRLAAYRMNAGPLTNNSFLTDMTTMLNTKKYMVATPFITHSGALRLNAAEAMYKLVKGMEPLDVNDTKDLFFQPAFIQHRPGNVPRNERYFDAPDTADRPSPPSSPQLGARPMDCDDGFMSETNPQGALPPRTRDTLSPFVRRMLTPDFSTPPTQGALASRSTHDASHSLGRDSPRSNDSGTHPSDDEFLDDDFIDEVIEELPNE